MGVSRQKLDKPDLEIIGSKYPFFALRHDPDWVKDILGLPKYIFLLRNPIDQVNSSINRRNRANVGIDIWHAGNVHDCIHDIKISSQLAASYLVHFRERVFLVKYEDLVDDAHATLVVVGSFLGIDDIVFPRNIPISPKTSPGQNSSRSVLTAYERKAATDAFGQADVSWPSRSVTGAREISNVFLGLVETLSVPSSIVYSPLLPGRPLLGMGWHYSFEPKGALMVGRDAYLIFSLDTSGNFEIATELECSFPDDDSEIEIQVVLNGELVAHLVWCPSTATNLNLRAPLGDVARVYRDGPLTLRFGPLSFSEHDVNSIHIKILGAVPAYTMSSPLDGLALRLMQFSCMKASSATQSSSQLSME